MNYTGLFPNDPGPPHSEILRVIKRGPEYTTFLVVRTQSEPEPVHLHLLIDRVPEQLVVGSETRMVYTLMELEWLQGTRGLP